MKKLLVFLAIMGLSVPAFSQVSPFLETGKSGLAISAGGECGWGFDGYVGKIGGSYKGILDIEAGFYRDNLDQSINGLLNDESTDLGLYGTATWWLCRKQPITNVEVNFGLLGGVEYANYSKYEYIHQIDGNTVSYDGYFGGFVGFDSKISIKLSKSWFLMPGYSAGFDFGKETQTELAVESKESYHGVVSKITTSLYKRLANGGALCFGVCETLDSFETGNYYECKVGYVLPLK